MQNCTWQRFFHMFDDCCPLLFANRLVSNRLMALAIVRFCLSTGYSTNRLMAFHCMILYDRTMAKVISLLDTSLLANKSPRLYEARSQRLVSTNELT